MTCYTNKLIQLESFVNQKKATLKKGDSFIYLGRFISMQTSLLLCNR